MRNRDALAMCGWGASRRTYGPQTEIHAIARIGKSSKREKERSGHMRWRPPDARQRLTSRGFALPAFCFGHHRDVTARAFTTARTNARSRGAPGREPGEARSSLLHAQRKRGAASGGCHAADVRAVDHVCELDGIHGPAVPGHAGDDRPRGARRLRGRASIRPAEVGSPCAYPARHAPVRVQSSIAGEIIDPLLARRRSHRYSSIVSAASRRGCRRIGRARRCVYIESWS